MLTNTPNTNFGIPPEALPAATVAPAVTETDDARRLRLQAAAAKLIAAEIEREEIELLVAEARAKRAGADLPTDTEGFRKEYLRVTIFEGSQAFDLPYVPLGIGGFVIKVPRGIEVIVPKEFVTECLAHAIGEVTVKSQGGLITRPVFRFPYNVSGSATEDEYRAFQSGQKKLANEQTMARTPA